MSNWQKVIAVTLIICLIVVTCGDFLRNLGAATPPNPALAKQQVELFGMGAELKVKLASGKKLRGSIGAIDAHGFDLISRGAGLPRRITYDEVAELKLAELTYRTSDSPNAEAVRRVVRGLGIGRHVALKVTSGKKLRGHLEAINEHHFVLLLDREARPMEIAYADVQQLGPNLSSGAKIAIIVGVAVAVVVVLWAIAVHEVGEVEKSWGQ